MTGLRRTILLACVCCFSSSGCEEQRNAPEGVTVSGSVRYAGELDLGQSRHISVVLASSYPTLEQVLNESQSIRPAELLASGQTDFSLFFVRPGSYRVWAEVFEDSDLTSAREPLALGGLGGVCNLRSPGAKIDVGDRDLRLDEFEIFDDGGDEDPCFAVIADAGVGDGGAVDPGPSFGRACEVDASTGGDDRSGMSEDCDPVAPLCVVTPAGGVCTRECEGDAAVCEAPTTCIDTSNFTDEADAPELCLDLASLLGG